MTSPCVVVLQRMVMCVRLCCWYGVVRECGVVVWYCCCMFMLLFCCCYSLGNNGIGAVGCASLGEALCEQQFDDTEVCEL